MTTLSLCCVLLTLWTLGFLVSDVSAGSNCGYYNTYSFYTYRYCSYGCCGSSYAYVCCSRGATFVLSGAAIAGIVMGVFTVVVVFFVIFFVLKKKSYWRGRRMVGHSNIVVSSSSTASKPVSTVQVGPPAPLNQYPTYPPPAYPPPQQPPSNNPAYPPPAYPPPQQPPPNNPAYPPPPSAYNTTTTSQVYF